MPHDPHGAATRQDRYGKIRRGLYKKLHKVTRERVKEVESNVIIRKALLQAAGKGVSAVLSGAPVAPFRRRGGTSNFSIHREPSRARAHLWSSTKAAGVGRCRETRKEESGARNTSRDTEGRVLPYSSVLTTVYLSCTVYLPCLNV